MTNNVLLILFCQNNKTQVCTIRLPIMQYLIRTNAIVFYSCKNEIAKPKLSNWKRKTQCIRNEDAFWATPSTSREYPWHDRGNSKPIKISPHGSVMDDRLDDCISNV